MAAAIEVDLGPAVGLGGGLVDGAAGDVAELLVDGAVLVAEAAADAAHAHVVDDDVALVEGEAELVAVVADEGVAEGPVAAAEGFARVLRARAHNHQRRLRPAVPHVEVLLEDDLLVREALVVQRLPRALLELLHLALELLDDGAPFARPHLGLRLLLLVHHVR